MNEEVTQFLEKAKHAHQVAQEFFDKGYYSDSASKSYYGIFYAAKALLVCHKIITSKHSAVESAFGLHFIKNGKLDQKYHRIIIDARKIRELADYAIDEEVIESVA